MNKKSLSPLVATILLVIFSLAIGTITMNWLGELTQSQYLEEEAKLLDKS